MNEVERRQRQRDRVGKRESGDNLYQFPKSICRKHRCTDEQEMIIASEDVANAVVEKRLKQ